MYKGHRIRARNQHLIYHFVLGWLLALFIGCMSVFYFQELRQFEISKLSFSTSEIDWSTKDLICLLGSFALSGGMILLYIHFSGSLAQFMASTKASSDDSRKPLV